MTINLKLFLRKSAVWVMALWVSFAISITMVLFTGEIIVFSYYQLHPTLNKTSENFELGFYLLWGICVSALICIPITLKLTNKFHQIFERLILRFIKHTHK